MFKMIFTAVSITLCSSIAFADNFKLTSPDVSHGKPLKIEQVFNGFGCTGKNISPALKWSGAPKDTKAFALSVYDPDAPTGSGWWHWVLFNIPASVTSLPQNAGSEDAKLIPKGAIQGKNDYGKLAFGGACPPIGNTPHHYHFTLTALKDTIPLKADASAAMIGYYTNQLSLGTATLTGIYQRTK